MLDKMDLSIKAEKEYYKSILPGLEQKAAELQSDAKELNIPILIVFEGWEAAGKGTLINHLILPMKKSDCALSYGVTGCIHQRRA